MKFFGSSPAAKFVEAYHPHMSIVILVAIGLAKYAGYHDIYKSFSDVSYASTMDHETGVHEHYTKGWNDLLFVLFFLQVVTVIRFFYTNVILKPIANYLKMGNFLRHKFLDSGWFSLYYIVATGIGIYLFRDDEWWYSSHHLWKGYPQPFSYEMKYYYLASLAFWIQCLLTFIFEAPRKDDGAYFFHHLLTIGLIVSSYHFNFFRVGAAILLEQNGADIFYYLAKTFKYSGLENVATGTLVVFVVTWIYTRHFIFGWILYSIWAELPSYISKHGWDNPTGYYYTEWLWYAFAAGLWALQGLMIYWFFMILRVVYRVVTSQGLSDTTDASDEEEEEEIKKAAEKRKSSKANGKSPKANGKSPKANGKVHTNGANGTHNTEKKKVK